MQTTESYDLIVVGGGLAGLTAACRAAEFGLTVVVLEAVDDPSYLCNSRITGGIFHVAMNDIRVNPEEALININNSSQGFAIPELAKTLADNAMRSIEWLKSNGIRFIKGGPSPELGTVLAPPRLQQFGLHWKGRGGDVLLRTLTDNLESLGGKLLLGARASQLVMKDGACVGVEWQNNRDESAVTNSAAVIIADGGFQGNLAMVGKYISPAPEKLCQRNAQTGKGDGIRMAEMKGAKLIGTDKFYGHVLHADARFNDKLWPHPMIDSMLVSGIAVDRQGKRIIDEGLGGVAAANAIAKLEDPLCCTVICDQVTWRGPAVEAIMGPNPNLAKAGGEIITAATIDELARLINLPVDQLERTVKEFNEAVAASTTELLVPTRTSVRIKPVAILEAPFIAVPVCSGITYSMGGIAIDAKARALDKNDQPIIGLYAAGASTGGLEGGPNSAYTGGLSKAAVFGMIAGESAAEQIRQASNY